MWVNSVLLSAGHAPIAFDDLETRLTDGVMLCQLLEQLSGKQIPGIDMHPIDEVSAAGNRALLWQFMAQEGVHLGGINGTCMSSFILLALIWRIVQRYLVGDVKEDTGELSVSDILLQWVHETSTETDIEEAPTNFHGAAWKSGLALCALLDGMMPGVINLNTLVEATPEDRIELALDTFQQQLGVPRLFTSSFFTMRTARADPKVIELYIATIHAHAKRSETGIAADAESYHRWLAYGAAIYSEAAMEAKSIMGGLLDNQEINDRDKLEEEESTARILEGAYTITAGHRNALLAFREAESVFHSEVGFNNERSRPESVLPEVPQARPGSALEALRRSTARETLGITLRLQKSTVDIAVHSDDVIEAALGRVLHVPQGEPRFEAHLGGVELYNEGTFKENGVEDGAKISIIVADATSAIWIERVATDIQQLEAQYEEAIYS